MLFSYLEQAGMEGQYNYNRGWENWMDNQLGDCPQGLIFGYRPLLVYQCPSDARCAQYPSMRDYFVVAGGKTPLSSGSGTAYQDGLFAVNLWRTMADITDGSSNTLAVGESVHVALRGMDAVPAGSFPATIRRRARPSDGVGALPHGRVRNRNPNGAGRSSRSTAYPINYTFTAAQFTGSYSSNDLPFGSYHSGGAQFVFADGHVAFLNDSIGTLVYQALSTIAGNETISAGAY